MVRRSFIQRLFLAGGATGLSASQAKTVKYRIKGFSCPTCAVGLDTMLSRKHGVIRSKSSYKEATTAVEFRPDLVSEKDLEGFIAEMGFSAARMD